ncbi:hypothetical protein [Nonomuraea sp. B1E8]|uniref:hypothetical protein n=1 Tax=unclassified Nonomuraea TaxID=2593643 RepID=UPI00325C3A5D
MRKGELEVGKSIAIDVANGNESSSHHDLLGIVQQEQPGGLATARPALSTLKRRHTGAIPAPPMLTAFVHGCW